jgi:hypothetical protein
MVLSFEGAWSNFSDVVEPAACDVSENLMPIADMACVHSVVV